MDTILIGIAGGTGSGKTTLADKLVESFGRDEVSILRHDNYYKRHDDIPFEERAKLNYDHPDAFDTDLLCQHILELKAGTSIEMPVYDYAMHNRSDKTILVHRERVCQDDFCKFSKFKYLSAEKSPNISCLHIS